MVSQIIYHVYAGEGMQGMPDNLSVGSRIQLWGRIQSREYQKRVGENNVVSRVAYEISVNKMEYIDDGINLERKVADSGNIG